MLPVIALVGRPNVGKSTLFNRLTRSRDALVADQPGLTRDRQYGVGKTGDRPYVVVDTGGLTGATEGIEYLMDRQVHAAIEEADHVFLILDAKAGCTPGDEIIAADLRRTGKPVTLVANKSEELDWAMAAADFHSMGLGNPVAIAAVHNRGVRGLIEGALARIPVKEESEEEMAARGIQVAIIGRPNVGKSTLVNRMLGEERVLVFDMPGTTRDSIHIPFERDDQRYTLVDTAGVRRRARVWEAIEKFSVIKTLQAIEEANVVVLVLDAREGVSEQDATLSGHILDSGRALVVAINKWDGLNPDQRQQVKDDIQRKLPFLSFADFKFISALHGSGVGDLFGLVRTAYDSATRDISTQEINRILAAIVQEHQPPLSHGRRIKLRYAHQGGRNPPLIIIHGNQVDQVPNVYLRYLEGRFRHALRLKGTPIRIEFRTGENPYEGKKNPLTDRQKKKRQRLKTFVKKGK